MWPPRSPELLGVFGREVNHRQINTIKSMNSAITSIISKTDKDHLIRVTVMILGAVGNEMGVRVFLFHSSIFMG